ncbi:SDR family NAD(P)-dependent oxidoreductase [Paenibacillus arenilitoris]|uniref:SDR family oxidoreductase n=1 Tax=Paenibacillus arenilitoris TaxID=2772299 RepID=A0A927CUM7_9BACL|nr:SDR family oxidoreductase [Paenibacillus arenilitoris]MBD2872526.1 SDR family oxidoreductase [Paenibacillus arenilitoris]
MDQAIRKRKALVTGGSRGIGRGIALTLASEGYDVAFSHWNDQEEAEKTAEEIREGCGALCYVFNGNLEDAAEPERLTRQSVDALGHIDLLVNNAGITLFGDFRTMEPESIDKLLRLNLRAPLLMMRHVGRHMTEKQIRGNIVNITSTRAERAYPGDSAYGGVKAGLSRAVQSAALDYAPSGIRVNCVAPGAIATIAEREPYYRALGRKIPLGRPGYPADVGRAVAWLASDQASYITGTTLRLDGGLILPGMPESVGLNEESDWRGEGQ